jgi:ketosteroid isomerase-like protein
MRWSTRQARWILTLTLLSRSLGAAGQGVAGLNEALATALKAGDLDALMSLHDSTAVLYPPGELDQKGQEAIRFRWGRVLKANTVKDVSFLEPTYAASGELSAGWGHVRLTFQPKSGEEPVTISGRFSAVARKKNGKWLYLFVSVGELDEILTFEHYSKAPPERKK